MDHIRIEREPDAPARRPLTRLQAAQRAEYRALVPCKRRRAHLLLISEEDHRGDSGALGKHYDLVGLVSPGEIEALRPLVQRWKEAEIYRLRLVEAEDGYLPLADLWHRGERVDSLRKGPAQEVAAATGERVDDADRAAEGT